jgi:hypothetical protein
MLHICARVQTVVLAVVAIAAAIRIPGWGLGVGVLYWARRPSSPTRAFGKGTPRVSEGSWQRWALFSCFRGC